MVEPSSDQSSPEEAALQLRQDRWELLAEIDKLTDRPLVVLAIVWLFLLILDFTGSGSGWLEMLSYGIWGLFILDFAIELLIAPKRLVYLRQNWLGAIALVLPAFRIVRAFRAIRVFRATRAARSAGLVRLISAVNRGVKALRKTFRRTGLGYVLTLTLLVTFSGAAGLIFFETSATLLDGDTRDNIGTYGDAVWWTVTIMTTLNSDFIPYTAAGRVLTFLLTLYGLAIFGYVTAAIASFFINQEPTETEAEQVTPVVPSSDAATLQAELAALRQELTELRLMLRGDQGEPGRQEVGGV